MLSILSTCSGLVTNCVAICWALSESPAVITWPVSTRELFTDSTRTREVGRTRAMVWAAAEESWSTRMSRRRIGRPTPSKNTASVWPLAMPRMEIRLGVRSTTSAIVGLVTVTSRASTGSSIRADLPLPSARVRAEAPAPESSMRMTPWLCAGAASGPPARATGWAAWAQLKDVTHRRARNERPIVSLLIAR